MVDYYLEGEMPVDSLQTAPTDPLQPHQPSWDKISTRDVLKEPSAKKSIPTQQQVEMAQSITDIFLLQGTFDDEDAEMVDGDDAEPEVDLAGQQQRTEKLKGILPTLAQLWWANSHQMSTVAEKLADGSRDPKWRTPLGDSGILHFFLEILSGHTLEYTLKIHVLRLVGNSCADTDENRARVVTSNYLPSIILQLRDTSLIPFAIPVLYNICIDYEPAQKQASDNYLTRDLIDLIGSPRFNESRPFLGYSCKILDLMIAQATEPEIAPENTAIVLLCIAADRELPVDMEDFIALVNTAVSYLQHEKFQKAFIAQGALDGTLSVLVDSYTRFDSHPSIGAETPDQNDAQALSTMRSNLNHVLSDISALPEFKEAYPIMSSTASSLRRWLLSPQLQLQVCACIMLGNLARSDATCIEFVHTSQVHKPLITILKDANDSQLLHAAIGFLKNLAMPLKNKEAIGNAGIFDVLPRLWALDTLQQIQFSSVSLARQLTIGTWENVRKVCKRLSEDQSSPAYSRTRLSLLIALFERTDVEPVKMEISRLITSVCRVYNTTTFADTEEHKRHRESFFLRHPDVGRPLGFMVSQTKWPVVRSEGWFVFALMARYEEGAQCISDLMQDVAVFHPLVEVLTGKTLMDFTPSTSSPESASSSTTSPASSSNAIVQFQTHSPESTQPNAQAGEMARIDRENALVLVSEMLKNRGSQMAVMRRTLFEDLLKGGTEIALSYQEARPGWGNKRVPREKRAVSGLNLQEVAEESFREL